MYNARERERERASRGAERALHASFTTSVVTQPGPQIESCLCVVDFITSTSGNIPRGGDAFSRSPTVRICPARARARAETKAEKMHHDKRRPFLSRSARDERAIRGKTIRTSLGEKF